MKFTFGTEAHGKITVEAKDWVDAFDRAGVVYRALDLVDSGQMKVYRLPKAFIDYYLTQFQIDGTLIRESKSHYFVAMSHKDYTYLLTDASHHSTNKDQSDPTLFGVCDSAKWTVLALKQQGAVSA